MSKTHPRSKPTQITRTFPGTEPPDDWDFILRKADNAARSKIVRRWAELPTFPPIKKGRGK